MMTHFVKHFFKNLSHNGINFLKAQKTDGHPVGKTYNFCATVAKAALHAVVVRAGGINNSDFSTLYANEVITIVAIFYSKLLSDTKIHSFDYGTVTGDFCMSRSLSGHKKI